MPEYNRKALRLKDFDYNSAGAYFITICTLNKKCILSRIVGTGVLDCPENKTGVLDCPEIQLTKYGEIAQKYIQQLNDFYSHISIDGYVIMPNHIHILLSIDKDADTQPLVNGQSGTPVPTSKANSELSRFISTFKRFCNKEYGENIWQSRFYDRVIRNQADFDLHLNYIFENPFKWDKDELFSNEN